MSSLPLSEPLSSAAVTRLSALAALDADELAAIRAAEGSGREVAKFREIMAERQPIAQPNIILAGWACRARIFADGRRQILSFLLPGDLIGFCRHRDPISSTTVTALTRVTLAPAPRPRPERDGAGLAAAYAMSAAIEEYYLLRQIGRLGRLSAHERLLDWLLETRERLLLAGLVTGNSFPMPITQDSLADALGLTAVHVNRTLQALRRDGLLQLQGGYATLPPVERLAALADHRPMQVSRSG
jgi:CRP-like cAMP-binding protein